MTSSEGGGQGGRTRALELTLSAGGERGARGRTAALGPTSSAGSEGRHGAVSLWWVYPGLTQEILKRKTQWSYPLY